MCRRIEKSDLVHFANRHIVDCVCVNKIISCKVIDMLLKLWCSTNSRVLFSMVASDLAGNHSMAVFILP
jgi:hypothetical protein